MIPVNAVLSLVAAFDVTVQWGLGWRYIFSSSFRNSVHKRWSTRKRFPVLIEATLMVVGFGFINAFLVLVIFWLFREVAHGNVS
jgi:hypothetical protein